MVPISYYADLAQQAFSFDTQPTLHIALPALEALHKAWYSRSTREKYAPYAEALEAGTDKLSKYNELTAESNTYTFTMCKLLQSYRYSLPEIVNL